LPLSVPFSAKNAVVLVVEDNFVNQTLLCRMLARLGHDVELANDGPSAVTLAAVKSFDLILMDINLPGFDGLEATRQIRIAGASKTAPIVGITAQILAQHRERMELVGMNRLVSKPITMNQLKQCLNEVIASNKNPLLNEDNSQDRTNLRALLGDSLLARLQVSCLRDVTLLMSYWPESVLDAVPELFHSNLHRALGSAAVLHEVRLHSILSDANEAAKSHDLERLVNLRHTLTDHVNAVRLRMRFNPSLDDAVGDWGNQSIAVN
jgi:CheY-like chemotaxis protein